MLLETFQFTISVPFTDRPVHTPKRSIAIHRNGKQISDYQRKSQPNLITVLHLNKIFLLSSPRISDDRHQDQNLLKYVGNFICQNPCYSFNL